jgi:hypothetical protein
MKKFLGILAIAGTLVACDNAGTGTSSEDSAQRAQDSIRREDSIRNATMPTAPATGDTGTTVTTDTTSKTTTTTTTDTTKH